MREGPDLARIAALVGDPARANMLTALMGGAALTASELALEAGVSLPTASSHLAKLSEGGLLAMASQGRHRYFSLSGPQIAGMLEAIMGVAATVGPRRARPGPKDEAMREARICYDHLAGAQAVRMFDRFVAERIIIPNGESVSLGRKAAPYFAARGIDVDAMAGSRRPLCRSCLDWSVRRSHLAGALGAAVLDRILAQKWARKEPGSRVVRFTPNGRQAFARAFLR
jgi:DNA-binding transcriptional ArsR family regulator